MSRRRCCGSASLWFVWLLPWLADVPVCCCAAAAAAPPIPRYLEDFSTRLSDTKSTSTRGAISVHINSNEHTDSTRAQNWIDFDAQW